jgi:hypothetical protein
MADLFEQGTYKAAPSGDVEDTAPPSQQVEWKPTGHELLIIITLAIVSLLVALDASIIVTSLGVSGPHIPSLVRYE